MAYRGQGQKVQKVMVQPIVSCLQPLRAPGERGEAAGNAGLAGGKGGGAGGFHHPGNGSLRGLRS